MFFYRRPVWGIGLKIFMIVLLIFGGTMMARSAFQVGFMQGAAVEGAEITAPFMYPHAKGFDFHPAGGSFLPFLAIFFGGILLIKLITSIIGLVMFKRWKEEGGSEMEDWKAWKFHQYRHYQQHCGPFHGGPWGAYPIREKPVDKENSEEVTEE